MTISLEIHIFIKEFDEDTQILLSLANIMWFSLRSIKLKKEEKTLILLTPNPGSHEYPEDVQVVLKLQ